MENVVDVYDPPYKFLCKLFLLKHYMLYEALYVKLMFKLYYKLAFCLAAKVTL